MASLGRDIASWPTSVRQAVDSIAVILMQVYMLVRAGRRERVAPDDIRHPGTFLDEYASRARVGIVLYDGAECRPLDRRILAVPLSVALGLS